MLSICFTSRAIHLEVVTSMSTDSFLMALDRFLQRRRRTYQGMEITCDNGTNLVGGSNELSRAVQDAAISLKDSCEQQGIKFNFIPPGTPHYGGTYERAIRQVKFHLVHAINLVPVFSDESLRTTMVRIESILNSRTIAFSDDGVPLCPNQLLLPFSLKPEQEMFPGSIPVASRMWRQALQASEEFWKRWRTAYLGLLDQKNFSSSPGVSILKAGLQVLLKDKGQFKKEWTMATILKAKPDSDGIIRTVRVKPAAGGQDYMVSVKDISLLETAAFPDIPLLS